MSVQQSDLNDPALVGEVDLARAAAQEEAGDERVGAYVDHHVEDDAAVTHFFEADKPSYVGWRWAVTVTSAGPDTDVTVSEVVLLPGPTALVAPEWIPWQNRVQAGDLGVGDLLPTDPDDERLVPAYLQSDDPAVEAVATETGLGRARVMSRSARLDAADRWHQSEFGPRSDMARSAPAHCGTCGFYLPLAGSLGTAFGTCGNELSPADAHVVHAEYGCGAHSEADVEQVSPVLVADLIYDDALLDVEPLEVIDEVPRRAASASPEAVAEPSSTEEAPIASAAESLTETPAAPSAAESTEPESRVADPSAAATEPELSDAESSAEVPAAPSAAEPAAESSVAESSSFAEAPAAEAESAEPESEIADPSAAAIDREPSVEESPAEIPAAASAGVPAAESSFAEAPAAEAEATEPRVAGSSAAAIEPEPSIAEDSAEASAAPSTEPDSSAEPVEESSAEDSVVSSPSEIGANSSAETPAAPSTSEMTPAAGSQIAETPPNASPNASEGESVSSADEPSAASASEPSEATPVDSARAASESSAVDAPATETSPPVESAAPVTEAADIPVAEIVFELDAPDDDDLDLVIEVEPVEDLAEPAAPGTGTPAESSAAEPVTEAHADQASGPAPAETAGPDTPVRSEPGIKPVEAAGPAAIEPVVTAETAPDESAPRE